MKDKLTMLVLMLLTAAFLLGWTGNTALKFSTMERNATTRAYQAGVSQVAQLPLKVAGNDKGYCVAITASDADFTLSTDSAYFQICATGNSAYLTFKDTAPGVTTSVGGFDMHVSDGQCHFVETTELLAAVIGPSAAGFICFYPMLSPGGTPTN